MVLSLCVCLLLARFCRVQKTKDKMLTFRWRSSGGNRNGTVRVLSSSQAECSLSVRCMCSNPLWGKLHFWGNSLHFKMSPGGSNKNPTIHFRTSAWEQLWRLIWFDHHRLFEWSIRWLSERWRQKGEGKEEREEKRGYRQRKAEWKERMNKLYFTRVVD